MDPISYKVALAAAGAGDAVPTADFVDEVFQSDLYQAFSSTDTTLENGPDFAGDGGMVWIKSRDSSNSIVGRHCLVDTERGINNLIYANNNYQQHNSSGSVKAFNSNGITIGGGNSYVASSDHQYCAFQFRRCKGFFDVVTWTGNGTAGHEIPHSLGSVPGAIFIKQTNSSRDWCVFHRGVDSTNPSHYKLHLNKTDGRADEATIFNDTEPTSTVFTVGTDYEVNGNGESYVAYLFAHDEQIFGSSNNQSIVKCGSYSGNDSTQVINLGWEPQWVLIKGNFGGGNWCIFDRKIGVGNWEREAWTLTANTLDRRFKRAQIIFHSQGFQLYNESESDVNQVNSDYVYVAIRAPHKVPTSGTEVFTSYTFTGNGTGNRRATMPSSATTDTDLIITKVRNASRDWMWGDRILGSDTTVSRLSEYLQSNTDLGRQAEENGGWYTYASDGEPVVGSNNRFNENNLTVLVNAFKRAPGFFDIVPYRGTGSNQYLYHNLGVKPEWIFVKRHSADEMWAVYTDDTGTPAAAYLNDTGAFFSVSTYWLAPNSALFGVGSANETNSNGDYYIAYLFADCTGVCKTTFYTGNGSAKFINCGFQPRFLMFKTHNAAGDWIVWCSGSGITTSADTYDMFNNRTNATPSQNFVNVSSSGVNIQSAGASLLNASGTNYLLLAIA